MITAGVDIGSLSAKAVLMEDGEIIASSVILTEPDSAETARKVMNKALAACGNNLRLENISSIVATGYGRIIVPFSHSTVTEISCHARGNHWVFPRVRTILDMGGQDCKAVHCDADGHVLNFIMNDKCAAGTGRYLERVAETLDIPLDEVGPRSLERVEGPADISAYCAVFALRDIQVLLREGKAPVDILAGACDALVSRILPLLHRVGVEEDFAISGGVAKNAGIVTRLEASLHLKAHIAPDPQIIGAIGACLFARDLALKVAASDTGVDR